jgi:hypothetical protein
VFGFSNTSSTKVFHCWHDGHLPSHLALSKPQLWQKYAILVLAICECADMLMCKCADKYQDLLNIANLISTSTPVVTK